MSEKPISDIEPGAPVPTLRSGQSPIPGPTASKAEIVQRELEMLPNTCPFDVTSTN
jgi:hypothetical protein